MTYLLKSGAIVPIRQKGEAYLTEVSNAIEATGVADALELGTPSRSHFLADASLTFFLEILGKIHSDSAVVYALRRAHAKTLPTSAHWKFEADR